MLIRTATFKFKKQGIWDKPIQTAQAGARQHQEDQKEMGQNQKAKFRER